jgi:single-strand DNA-binding protein
MAARSLNKVTLIGNLTRDPDLRYTPTGAAVCTIGLATSRTWTTDAGEKKEDVEFHRIVAWRKLAEICGQYLVKGKKIYLEGHLATRKYTTQDGQEKSVTEIVMDDMIMLDSKRASEDTSSTSSAPVHPKAVGKPAPSESKAASAESSSEASEPKKEVNETQVSPDDIPF